MIKIITNKIQCKNCGDIIESTYTHDWVECSCGRVSVDGGHEYMKRSFKEEGDYIELSETREYTEQELQEMEEERKRKAAEKEANFRRWVDIMNSLPKED